MRERESGIERSKARLPVVFLHTQMGRVVKRCVQRLVDGKARIHHNFETLDTEHRPFWLCRSETSTYHSRTYIAIERVWVCGKGSLGKG